MAAKEHYEETSAQKLANFHVVDSSYKIVAGTAIPVSILWSKTQSYSGKRPVIVRWHGGGLITGHRLFAEWLSPWLLDLAQRENAILVFPDYRLLPEANIHDILADVEDMYKWLLDTDSLEPLLPRDVAPDRSRLLVAGESAGGYIALQSALLLPTVRVRISILILMYPMIDMSAPHYVQHYHKDMFDPPVPQLPAELWADHVAALNGRETVINAMPPARLPLMMSAVQQGRFGELLGADPNVYPLAGLGKVDALPPIWLLHGDGDTVVPAVGSRKFAAALDEQLPNVPLRTAFRPGDHGFDSHIEAYEDDEWLKEGLAFVAGFWPR